MHLQTGTFVNWPFGPYWEDNADLLELMHITWTAWRFYLNTSRGDYKWSPADINFDTWLNDGRPEVKALSDIEKWMLEQEEADNA